jgi:benzoyl-CoA 2,3-dioxygenase component B
MVPMLKEESFHLGTGQDGIKRVVKAGVMPLPIVQKFINKWIPVSLDLFGVDHSSSAHWFYVWGLKGRFDEPSAKEEADLGNMNDHNRKLYHLECQQLINMINKSIPAGQPKLYVPDMKFNRRIGEFANQPYSVTGELLSEKEYAQHIHEVLPQPEDIKLVMDIQANEAKWIAPKVPATTN